jgi:uncharacterized oxidoreductase
MSGNTKGVMLDIESAESISTFAALLTKDYPALNAVIHHAGIMRPEVLKNGATADAEAMVTPSGFPGRLCAFA